MTAMKGNVLEKNEAKEVISREGLCMTCKHSSSCMYLNGSADSILNCEEFENEEKIESKSALVQEKREDASSKVFAGLCANCENRNTCTFERNESGVWHCEEYK